MPQAFFAQIYSEAQSSKAAPGHVAIAELHRMGRLQRHYTLNIDGLAAVSIAIW
jgi:NAD-dependent SIR2 family protein deacetylase